MFNNSKLKTRLAMVVALIVVFSSLSVFAKSSKDNDAVLNGLNNQIITTASDEINVNETGLTLKDEKRLAKKLAKLNLAALQKAVSDKGADVTITSDTILSYIKNGIKDINTGISKKKLKVLKKGTIVRTDDTNFYLQGGATYSENYWWGQRRYLSTDAANAWVRDLNKAAAANATAGVIAGAVFGGVGAIPNGLTCGYCLMLASDAAYVNSTTTNGIKADICWWLYYTIVPQW